MSELAAAETELRRREQQSPRSPSPQQLQRLQTPGSDIGQVWKATTTTAAMARLLHMLLEELTLNLKRAEGHARLTLRWRGGTVTTLEVPVPAFPAYGARTDEDTISLLLPASRPYETANSGQNVNIVSST